MKPIHGAPKPVNVPADMTDVPPVPCEFRAGDIVTYTNDYGVKFRARVRGFKHKLRSYTDSVGLLNPDGSSAGRINETTIDPKFIYLEFWRHNEWRTDGSAWWCAHDPEQLRKESA
jgi:hypothetical protein